jgi:hypothetical protein
LGKILVVLDYFTESLLGFASMIFSPKENQHYVGISLSSMGAVSVQDSSYNAVNTYGTLKEMIYEKIEQDESDLINSFQWAAQKFKVSYNVHLSAKVPSYKIQEETCYSDIVLISSTFSNNPHLSEDFTVLLECSQCPVMIIPAQSVTVENIIIPIGDHVSSIASLKMISYLLPGFLNARKITVLAKKPTNEIEMKRESYLMELLTNHFDNPGFQWLLSDDPVSEVMEYLSTVQSPLLVLGNNKENNLGSLFSYNDLSKMQTIPIFIGD